MFVKYTELELLFFMEQIYWKEKETHILTFQTSDLLYEQILSWYQQFIPADTED